MHAESIKFREHPCFKTEWSGFDAIKPINVIIGRNNTGKSHLLDLVRSMCDGNVQSQGWEVQLCGKLEQEQLVNVFSQNQNSSHGHTMWVAHGVHFVGAPLTATYKRGNLSSFEFPEGPESVARGMNPLDTHEMELRKEGLNRLLKTPDLPLHGNTFHRLLADRNIVPEVEDNNLRLEGTGAGATNIVRRYGCIAGDAFSAPAARGTAPDHCQGGRTHGRARRARGYAHHSPGHGGEAPGRYGSPASRRVSKPEST